MGTGPQGGSRRAPADAREIYGPVAELYDEVRPGYPDDLIADVIRLSGVAPDGVILEVGCGPGKATVQLARHGRKVVAVDPVPEMLAVAGRRCARLANVEFREGRFEDLPIADGSVDLVVAAQSFHWIRPDIGYRKAALVLRRAGCLALIWTEELPAGDALESALRAIYARIAPGVATPVHGGGSSGGTVREIDGTGLFGPVATRRYPWSTRYDAATRAKMLNTMSSHRALPESTRRVLIEEVRRAIEAHGGVLRRDLESKLYLAWRAGPDLR